MTASDHLSGQQFEQARSDWESDQSAEITTAAAAQLGSPRGWSGSSGVRPEHHEAARVLMSSAQPVHEPLYSGHTVTAPHGEVGVGDTLHVPLMSASKHEHMARGFARPDDSLPPGLVYRFPRGAQGAKINDHEYAVTGKYKVTGKSRWSEPGDEGHYVDLEPHR